MLGNGHFWICVSFFCFSLRNWQMLRVLRLQHGILLMANGITHIPMGHCSFCPQKRLNKKCEFTESSERRHRQFEKVIKSIKLSWRTQSHRPRLAADARARARGKFFGIALEYLNIVDHLMKLIFQLITKIARKKCVDVRSARLTLTFRLPSSTEIIILHNKTPTLDVVDRRASERAFENQMVPLFESSIWCYKIREPMNVTDPSIFLASKNSLWSLRQKWKPYDKGLTGIKMVGDHGDRTVDSLFFCNKINQLALLGRRMWATRCYRIDECRWLWQQSVLQRQIEKSKYPCSQRLIRAHRH